MTVATLDELGPAVDGAGLAAVDDGVAATRWVDGEVMGVLLQAASIAPKKATLAQVFDPFIS